MSVYLYIGMRVCPLCVTLYCRGIETSSQRGFSFNCLKKNWFFFLLLLEEKRKKHFIYDQTSRSCSLVTIKPFTILYLPSKCLSSRILYVCDQTQVTHDTWPVTHGTWPVTHGTWPVTHDIFSFSFFFIVVLLSPHVKRFSVSHMRVFSFCYGRSQDTIQSISFVLVLYSVEFP